MERNRSNERGILRGQRQKMYPKCLRNSEKDRKRQIQKLESRGQSFQSTSYEEITHFQTYGGEISDEGIKKYLYNHILSVDAVFI